MREEVAAHVGMRQLKNRPQRVQVLTCSLILALVIQNLQLPLIVRVSRKVIAAAIRADLEMVLVFGHGRLVVVRVEALEGWDVLQADDVAALDVFQFVGNGSVLLLKNPVVVSVLVWVECDLLLYIERGGPLQMSVSQGCFI